jgi:DNA-binding transcriptional ArsR family regulator
MVLPEIPTPEDLLASVDAYLDFIGGLYAAKDKSIDQKTFREAHDLLQDPQGMMALVVFHLRDMWHSAMAEAWAHMQPVMQASVEALQNIDYRGMSAVEAGRIITGRDLGLSFGEHLDKATHIVFSPAPHCGPYVSLGQGETLIRVFFRPRLPEGSKTKSIELDRSDLMVRLSALADDTRLRILELFTQHEELCAPDVMQLLDLSQSAASRHLRQLTATGYLTERRREVTKCYSLNRARIEGTLQSLKTFLLHS